VYLKRGDVMTLGIDGLGEQIQKVVAFLFAPARRVAHVGYGGFLMLEYQKSSAATPHVHNALGIRSNKRLHATKRAKQRRTQTSGRG
jgi:hypothetical protein